MTKGCLWWKLFHIFFGENDFSRQTYRFWRLTLFKNFAQMASTDTRYVSFHSKMWGHFRSMLYSKTYFRSYRKVGLWGPVGDCSGFCCWYVSGIEIVSMYRKWSSFVNLLRTLKLCFLPSTHNILITHWSDFGCRSWWFARVGSVCVSAFEVCFLVSWYSLDRVLLSFTRKYITNAF